MKRKTFGLITLALTFAALMLAAACSAAAATFKLAETKVWLDRYEEKVVQLEKGDAAALKWTSGDEKVVTVNAGKLIAQGEGSTVVTVSDGNASEKIDVRVTDSGVKPKIGFTDFNVYLNTPTQIPATLDYAGKEMKTEIDYKIEPEDPSYFSVNGNELTGLKLGSVKAVLSAEWKGLSLRAEVTVHVENPVYMEAEKEIRIHNVETKLGKADLGVRVYKLGKEIENASVQYTVTQGEDFVRVENGTVYAQAEGEAVVQARYTADGAEVSAEICVTVLPNYIETSFRQGNEMIPITFCKHDGEVGGRKSDNMYEYRAADGVDGNTCWNNRIVNAEEGKSLLEFYRAGYRYFAFDVYYTSHENLMVGCHNLTSWISVGEYMRRDYLTIAADGEAINRLEKTRWVTMIYDIKVLWEQSISLPSSFFFFVNDDTTTQYVMNARWYLDDKVLPKENLSYIERENYVQATNDEFAIGVPVSTGYKKGQDLPSIAVTPETVPSYEPSSGIGGRKGAYRYATRATGSESNRLVVVKSLNATYDDGMYAMSQLGTHLAFDVYPESGTSFTFRMNGEMLATVLPDRTNLGEFENWLIVIKDGKRQSSITLGEWQTVVIAVADNYDSDRYSSMISFSADAADSVVYLDNVRYYKNGDFIPNQYADDKYAPYLYGEAKGATVGKLAEGAFKGAYEFVNPADARLAFKGVTTEDGSAGECFKGGYQFVRMGVYFADNVSSFTVRYQPQNGGTAYTETIEIGKDFNSDYVFAFRTDETAAFKLERNIWYTVYFAVKHTSNDVAKAELTFGTAGGSDGAPAKAYLKNVAFEYAVNTVYTKTNEGTSGLYSVEYIKDGAYAGSWKYTNATCGGNEGDTKNWGESGVRFSRVHAVNDGPAGAFFKDGYKWVKADFLFTESVETFSIRFSAGTNHPYWVQFIPFNTMLPQNVYAMNAENSRVNVLEYGVWYSLYIPVDQTSTDNDWYTVSVYTNGGSEKNPAVSYVKNVEYLKDWVSPEYPSRPTSPIELSPSLKAGNADYYKYVSLEKQQDGAFKGAYKYENKTSGEEAGENQNWGESGLYFSEVYDPITGADQETFYSCGYSYVRLSIYFDASVNSFTLRITDSVDSNAWIQKIQFGSTEISSDYWFFTGASGARVYTLQKQTWYTMWIKPVKGERLCILPNGGSSAAPSVVYLKDLSYEKEMPLLPSLVNHQDYKNVKIEEQAAGEFAGTCKYTNGNLGRPGGVYGESGIYFNEVYNPHLGAEQETFFRDGYSYIRFDFYVGANVDSIDLRHGYTVDGGWMQEWTSQSLTEGVYWLYDASGNPVNTGWKAGEWYTLVIKPVKDTFLAIQTNGGSAENPPVMYLKNISYEKTPPFAA